MYAIIETGGKQFRVAQGDEIRVEKLAAEVGDTVEFDRVLAVMNDDESTFGAPVVDGAVVKATVLEQGKADKVIIFKYLAKKDHRKKKGHRQPFTAVRIESISL